MIQETPSDFTWSFFNDSIIVGLKSDANWSGKVVLSVFQVRDNTITNRITTDAVETNADELRNGISTEKMFPDSELFPASEWFMSARWKPDKIFNPGDIEKTITDWAPAYKWSLDSYLSPTKVESVTLDFKELTENEILIVVYTHLTGDTDRKQITRPFGLVLKKRNANGTDNF